MSTHLNSQFYSFETIENHILYRNHGLSLITMLYAPCSVWNLYPWAIGEFHTLGYHDWGSSERLCTT
jgi:hypothetical protein